MQISPAQQIAAWLMPVLLAITVHETAHGWVARRFGDQTAEKLGRLTLNPLRHIDPVGTILMPGLMLLMPGRFCVRLGQAGAGRLAQLRVRSRIWRGWRRPGLLSIC